jgi:hypothetical protein
MSETIDNFYKDALDKVDRDPTLDKWERHCVVLGLLDAWRLDLEYPNRGMLTDISCEPNVKD